MPNVLKLYLENGQTKAFKFEANTTVKVLRVTLSLSPSENVLAPRTPRRRALQLTWCSYNRYGLGTCNNPSSVLPLSCTTTQQDVFYHHLPGPEIRPQRNEVPKASDSI